MPDFGIGEILAAIGSAASATSGAIGSGLTALGVGSATAADIGAATTSALEGAGLGAGTAAITGGDPLKGAAMGGLTAGALSGVGSGLDALGVGTATAPAAGTAGGGTSAAAAGAPSAAAAGGTSDLTASSTLSALGPDTSLAAGGTTITPAAEALGAPSAAPAATSVTPQAGTTASTTAPTSFADAASKGSIGTWVGNQLGLGPTGSALLNKFGGPLVEGGVMMLEAGQQQRDLQGMLAPLQSQAQLQSKEAASLESAMFGGQLPPGAQTALDQATTAAQARVRATYAGLGLSGSTMEADALNQVQAQAAAQKFQFAQQLLQAGVQASQISDQLYSNIIGAEMQQNSELSNAIQNFAASLLGSNVPGSGRTLTLNLGA